METTIAIFAPSNKLSNPPSNQYFYQGRLSEDELVELEDTLANTNCAVIIFESEEDFDSTMKVLDTEYWESRK